MSPLRAHGKGATIVHGRIDVSYGPGARLRQDRSLAGKEILHFAPRLESQHLGYPSSRQKRRMPASAFMRRDHRRFSSRDRAGGQSLGPAMRKDAVHAAAYEGHIGMGDEEGLPLHERQGRLDGAEEPSFPSRVPYEEKPTTLPRPAVRVG